MLNEYEKIENDVKEERQPIEPSFYAKLFFASIYSVGWLLFIIAILSTYVGAHKGCDACPIDYYEDAPLSTLCRYMPEPHILYQRECHIVRPYKETAIICLAVGLVMIFGGQWSFFYYELYLKNKSV